MISSTKVVIDNPDWVKSFVALERCYVSDNEKMRLAIALSLENVVRDSGGPFGAAIFNRDSGELVSVGVNSVLRLNNCILHAEIIAIMMAQARLSCYTLSNESDYKRYELFTSCEPCAMCLGAALWSGIGRLVCGAKREDALRLGFEEGPVFATSHAYLEERGVEIVHGVLREEANASLDQYSANKGVIYNG
jgi:tRNA(Arg) A34 adenosine deaminase TadA